MHLITYLYICIYIYIYIVQYILSLDERFKKHQRIKSHDAFKTVEVINSVSDRYTYADCYGLNICQKGIANYEWTIKIINYKFYFQIGLVSFQHLSQELYPKHYNKFFYGLTYCRYSEHIILSTKQCIHDDNFWFNPQHSDLIANGDFIKIKLTSDYLLTFSLFSSSCQKLKWTSNKNDFNLNVEQEYRLFISLDNDKDKVSIVDFRVNYITD